MLETPYSCSLCHKEFAQLQALGNHVETIHVQLKGQLISECLFDNLKFSKKTSKNLTNSCPRV